MLADYTLVVKSSEVNSNEDALSQLPLAERTSTGRNARGVDFTSGAYVALTYYI